MLWSVAALCLALAGATLSRSIEYETVSVIRYRGQGLLNHKADDIYFSVGMRVGFVDGYEYPMLDPRNVQQAGYYDSTRRYWLRGPLLELLGKGYDIGNPPSPAQR